MRKLLFAVVVVVVAVFLALPAFAQTEEVPDWLKEKFEWQNSQVNEMMESGELTEEQGELLKERFEDRYNWQTENEFVCPRLNSDADNTFRSGTGRNNFSNDTSFNRGQGRGMGPGTGTGMRGQACPFI